MFNLLNIVLKLDADKKIQEKHKDKKLKHEYQIDLNHLMGILNYKFNHISNGQRKRQTKNNQTNTTTSTKQTSNQKRKKKKTLKTPQMSSIT